MRYTLIPAVLFLLCAIPTRAQVQVSVTKSTKLTDFVNSTFEQNVTGTDTFYTLTFRDSRYSTIVRHEVKIFKQEAAVDFVDGLVELLKEEYKPKEATVKLDGLLLMKSETFGMSYVAFFSDTGAWSSVTPKQARKMKKALYDTLGRPLAE